MRAQSDVRPLLGIVSEFPERPRLSAGTHTESTSQSSSTKSARSAAGSASPCRSLEYAPRATCASLRSTRSGSTASYSTKSTARRRPLNTRRRAGNTRRLASRPVGYVGNMAYPTGTRGEVEILRRVATKCQTPGQGAKKRPDLTQRRSTTTKNAIGSISEFDHAAQIAGWMLAAAWAFCCIWQVVA